MASLLFRRLLQTTLLLSLLSCRVQNPPPRPTQTIRVGFQDSWDTPGWRQWHYRAVAKGLTRLDATGFSWVVVTQGWDVQVRTFDANGNCEEAGGRYQLNRPFVEVDPGCVQTAEQLRYVVAHELVHWFTYTRLGWVGHLCTVPGETSDCSELHYGVGLLNPTLGGETEDTLAIVRAELTQDDITLLQLLREHYAR